MTLGADIYLESAAVEVPDGTAAAHITGGELVSTYSCMFVTLGTATVENISVENSTSDWLAFKVFQGVGIYHPQQGEISINSGATVSGKVGVQICAGVATINDGAELSSTEETFYGSPVKPSAQNDGSIQDGSALSVLCTRGQTVTFLHRYAKTPAAGGENPFTDVAEGAYCYNAVLWAVANGITSGTSATTFGPDVVCTRGQIVTFLYRALAEKDA